MVMPCGPVLCERTAFTATDKRLAAPERHTNPVYRTLQQIYLLASDWLLQQGDVEGIDEAEQRRITFHLRQFVDAMSPTLMLLWTRRSAKAVETGGTSVSAGAANLIADLNAGRLSMVDTEAFAPGGNCFHTRKGGPPQSPDGADPVRAPTTEARRSGWQLSGDHLERCDAAAAPQGGPRPDRRGGSGDGAIRQDRTVWLSWPTG